MPTKITMRVEFQTPSGETRSFTDTVSDDTESTDEHKEALARELFAELRKGNRRCQDGLAEARA